MKIRKGDTVTIMAGNDKGKHGKVLNVSNGEKVLVEGVNIRKRHKRARQGNQKGEIITMPAPLPMARVALACVSCAKPVRVGFSIQGGKKTRVCKKCGKEI